VMVAAWAKLEEKSAAKAAQANTNERLVFMVPYPPFQGFEFGFSFEFKEGWGKTDGKAPSSLGDLPFPNLSLPVLGSGTPQE